MKILIPSRSRSSSMVTPYQFPERYRKDIIVYAAREQYDDYVRENPELQIRTVNDMNDLLGKKLELMARNVEDKFVMMCDDDFVFFRRKEIDQPQLRKMEDKDWDEMFSFIEFLFQRNENRYGVGVSMRQGNNRLDKHGNENTRLNGCIAYDRSRFLSVEHDRVNPMNDFDVNLQLLRKGYDNFLMSEFCYNQGGTNAPGGSSDYRDLTMQAAAAHRLAELHPGFVKIRMKKNKTGDPSLRERTEVTCYWKKARECHDYA